MLTFCLFNYLSNKKISLVKYYMKKISQCLMNVSMNLMKLNN
jgi:hypothetical protein